MVGLGASLCGPWVPSPMAKWGIKTNFSSSFFSHASLSQHYASQAWPGSIGKEVLGRRSSSGYNDQSAQAEGKNFWLFKLFTKNVEIQKIGALKQTHLLH